MTNSMRKALRLAPLSLLIASANPQVRWSEDWKRPAFSAAPCRPVAALFCAIENFDNTEVAKIVEAGADINAQGPKGGYEGTDNDLPDLPLCLAVRMSNTEAIHILVEHGANVNGDCFGSSPISNAAGYGQEVLLDYLLQHGADPNKSDTDEMSLSLLMHCVEGPDNTPQEGPTIVTGSAG